MVTSVPSDAPDDYIALMDLKKKPALREKYGVKVPYLPHISYHIFPTTYFLPHISYHIFPADRSTCFPLPSSSSSSLLLSIQVLDRPFSLELSDTMSMSLKNEPAYSGVNQIMASTSFRTSNVFRHLI